jgi:uncharacterized protein
MAPTTTRKQVIHSIYDAFKRSDTPFILSHVAPEATWRQTQSLPWGGDYRGPQGAAEFFQKLNENMETTSFEALENFELGEEVFSFGSYSGRSRATGRIGSAEWMFRWRIRDGRIVAWDSYIDSAPLVAALK